MSHRIRLSLYMTKEPITNESNAQAAYKSNLIRIMKKHSLTNRFPISHELVRCFDGRTYLLRYAAPRGWGVYRQQKSLFPGQWSMNTRTIRRWSRHLRKYRVR